MKTIIRDTITDIKEEFDDLPGSSTIAKFQSLIILVVLVVCSKFNIPDIKLPYYTLWVYSDKDLLEFLIKGLVFDLSNEEDRDDPLAKYLMDKRPKVYQKLEYRLLLK